MLIALLAVPALAQDKGPKTTRSDAEKQQDAEVDKAYQRTLKASGSSAKAAPVDPWGNVRQSPVNGGGDKH
jgi:hypothetical protein